MKDNNLHILIIDDNPKDYHSFWMRYGNTHEIVLKHKPDEGINEAKKNKWDIILVDLNYGLGFEEGLTKVLPQVIAQVKKNCPVLVVTSDTRLETQQLVLQSGASGIILKAEWYDEFLFVEIKKAVKNHTAKVTTAVTDKLTTPQIGIKPLKKGQMAFIFASSALHQLQTQLDTAVNYPDAPVLILGETGVGKEVAVRYLHKAKGGGNMPLEIVNLSALSKELVASELFGHVKGAFTGATSNKIGYFERADSGVLFLDEIGEVTHDVQVQLLRALENRTFQQVGGTRELKLNAHLVFATNKNLREAIKNGEIREDFLQRISTLTFTIPPLRERLEDILPLAEYFFENNLHPAHPLMGKTIQEAFTEEAFAKFYEYNWPGNVRELRNTIQRLLFDTEMKKKALIDLASLPNRLVRTVRPLLEESTNVNNQQTPKIKSTTDWDTDKLSAYGDLKRIEEALIKEGGRKLEAAQRLGLSNDQTLRYRVQKKYFAKYPELFEEFQTIIKVYKLKE